MGEPVDGFILYRDEQIKRKKKFWEFPRRKLLHEPSRLLQKVREEEMLVPWQT